MNYYHKYISFKDKMSVSCCEVLGQIFKKPKNENVCWIYFLRPLLYICASILLVGILYLYLVPFTNIVGQGLFADYKCTDPANVWGACGKRSGTAENRFDASGTDVAVGFFVFLIIQSTIGFYILATLFYCQSRRKGYVKRFKWNDCCNACSCMSPNRIREWVNTDNNQQYECCNHTGNAGPCLYFSSTIFFVIATFVSTIIIGIWVGRTIAINSVSHCIPYQNTRIGLYGCVSNVNGQYVGGSDCSSCTGIGFGIFAMPLYILEVLSIYLFIVIKKCSFERNRVALLSESEANKFANQRKIYKDTREKIRLDKINQNVDYNTEFCPICLEAKQKYKKLPCNHNVCFVCTKKIDKCPLCRADFTKKQLRDYASENIFNIEVN